MGSRLLEFLRLGRCSHEFSWPRRWPDGDYYQVCLICGEEYKYDWNTMSRLERISGVRKIEPERAGGRPGRGHSRKKASWSPRARRIKLNGQEMKFRIVGTTAWQRGAAHNISETGILFHTADAVPNNAELEMILEMPREIVGQEHSQVLARGMVVRNVPPEDENGHPGVAAGIWDYKVLHDKEDFPAADTGKTAADTQ
jgi:hypothetical protein